MKKSGVFLLVAIMLPLAGCGTVKQLRLAGCEERNDEIGAGQLRCEYRRNPIGIDVERPGLSWIIESGVRGQRQSGYQILAASDEKKLGEEEGDLWDSGKVAGSESIQVFYDGKALASGMRVYWKVRVWDKEDKVSRWSSTAFWEMALRESSEWAGEWINDGGEIPKRDEDFYKDDPVCLFRKEFSVDKKIKWGRLYISGLGYYEAYLNGERIGDYVLDPGWTSYEKRVLYSSYDVTGLVREKRNCLGVMVGNGWYNPLPMLMWGGLNLREYLPVGRPRLIAQLNIEYSDGTKQCVVSDESWKVGKGAILRNNVYLGEVYDGRKEQPGWNKAGFDDKNWGNARIAKEKLGVLRAQQQPPIKVVKTISPVKLTEPKPGVYVFDMGQNFAGWVKLRVKGPAGSVVKMRYGELLNPDGTVNGMTAAAGQIKSKAFGGPGAPAIAYQSDSYILKGEGEEIYSPRFTFHGFRYVEVTGYPGKCELDSMEGAVLCSAVESVGSFSCSNEMFNRIQAMTRWAITSNLFSVQSDCPAREKFSYGGDIVPSSEAVMLNFDMATFYRKTVFHLDDAAFENGGLTETAPFVGIGGAEGGVNDAAGPIGWGTAHPMLLSQLYQYYGNKELIKQQYQTAKRWVEYLQGVAEDHIITKGISDHESIAAKPVELTGTAFYYYNVCLCSKFARMLGVGEDAERFGRLADNIKNAFNKKFFDAESGLYDIGTQACQSFALYMDLVPRRYRRKVVDALVEDIMVKHKGHLSTGIFGTKYMLAVLSDFGKADTAYTIVNQKTFPGWGYMLENGATTLWEHWAFSDNVYSHNHAMFGSVSEWFIKTIAGISADREAMGFDKIVIRPEIVGDLTWAKGSYKSIRGEIKSSWRIENQRLHLDITIPANTTAMVYVPAENADDVTESGMPALKVNSVKFMGSEKGKVIFSVRSGHYRFVSKLPVQ